MAVRYGMEIPAYVPLFRAEIVQLAKRGLRTSISTADTGSAVFAAAVHDLSTVGEKSDPVSRRDSPRLGGLSMKYMNFADDAIDDPTLGLSQAEKRELIIRLVDGIWEPEQIGELFPPTKYFDMAIAMGQILHNEVCERDTHGSYASTMQEFADAEAAHGEDITPEGLLASVIQLGRPCGTIMSSSVGIVTGKSDNATIKAAESLGIYGMLLDHAYEVNADLRDNSPTIVTAIIKRDGNSRKTRKEARELCLDQASDMRRAGMEQLSPKQKKIYIAIARLFDSRYKIVVRLRDSFVR